MLKTGIFALVPLVLFLGILECVFRFVIPSSEVPSGYFDDQTRLYRFPGGPKTGIHSVGPFATVKADWRINNAGWNYPIDYDSLQSRPLIAWIGDSFIEALQVDSDRNAPYLLREKLFPKFDVYAFGKSGASFAQYLHMSRQVVNVYSPEMLIINLVHNDFFESLDVGSGDKPYFMNLRFNPSDSMLVESVPTADLTLSQFVLWKRLLNTSALFRYVYRNLLFNQVRFERSSDSVYEANIDTSEAEEHKTQIHQLVRHLMNAYRTEFVGTRILFVLDAPRQAIYEKRLEQSRVVWLNYLVWETAREYGFDVVDMTEIMQADYQQNGIRFEFDIDYHWNEYAHSLVAETVRPYVQRQEK